MWIGLVILLLFLLGFICVYQRRSKEETTRGVSTCPKINTWILLIYYGPRFLVQGLVPAILEAHKNYGSTFCLQVWGMKRRIFFITGLSGRQAVSKSPCLKLPAAQLAHVFGVGNDVAGKKNKFA